MIYTRQVTDYETGEVFRISLGEHLTFTEVAKKLEVTRPVLNKAMMEGGLCQKEFDAVAGFYRVRLHPDAVEKGLGFRIISQHGPFDVLSPLGQELTEESLRAYLIANSPTQWRPAFDALWDYEGERQRHGLGKMQAQMRVCWLLDHFGDIPADVIAKGIGVSWQLVYRHKSIRNGQLKALMKCLKCHPEQLKEAA